MGTSVVGVSFVSVDVNETRLGDGVSGGASRCTDVRGCSSCVPWTDGAV